MSKTKIIISIIIIVVLAGVAGLGLRGQGLAGLFSVFGKSQTTDNQSVSENQNVLPATQAEETKENPAPEQADFPQQVLLDIPFTPQAPFGNWDDVRQDNGCEEASILMAMHWITGDELTADIALKEIVAMSDFQLARYGHFHDSSTEDTLKLLNDYFQYENAFIRFDISVQDIKKELALGNAVIVPVDGKKLGNPYYSPPGPDRHKLIIIGYDDNIREFITNDPGTKRGEKYRYAYEVMENSIVDYKTGMHEPISEIRTAMLVVEK